MKMKLEVSVPALVQIVTGGQTGVDRAVLDAALAAGIPVGGWCPKGRRAEDGAIASHYLLTETPLSAYAQRTAWNVRDSEGTLVLLGNKLSPGTNLTVDEAQAQGKPLRIVDLSANGQGADVALWIVQNEISVLNVAGPRESEEPGIYEAARKFLEDLIEKIQYGSHDGVE